MSQLPPGLVPKAPQAPAPAPQRAPAPPATTPAPVLNHVPVAPTTIKVKAKNVKAHKLYQTSWGFTYVQNVTVGQQDTVIDYFSYRGNQWTPKTLAFYNDNTLSWYEVVALPNGIPLPPSPDFGSNNVPTAGATVQAKLATKAPKKKQVIPANAYSKTCKQCGQPNTMLDTGALRPLYWCKNCEP